MHDTHDPHAHRNLETVEEPLDAANQSLSDALRSSFTVLKAIMVILVGVYLFSNVKSVQPHEEALVLRMGALRRVVTEAGSMWAFPEPIDQIVKLPTRKSNELLIDSHTFRRRKNEIGKPLSFISRGPGSGLNPSLDGALLTADTGLVHVQWKVTYKINDLRSFVTNLHGKGVEAAEELIRVFVETTGVEVASELTAEETIRTRVDHVQSEMRRRINERLAAINSGIVTTLVEMYEPTPPIQVRSAFDRTQQAENGKEQAIRNAEKIRTEILNGAAGAAHSKLIELIDTLDRLDPDTDEARAARAELDRVLLNEAEGEAGQRIKNAGAYQTVVLARMKGDVARYRTLLPEYKRNPLVLQTRLWEATKQELFESPGVTKIYRPVGLKEFRIKIPLDPEERRAAERRRVSQTQSDSELIRPTRVVPVGPEYD